ncbi:Pilin (type 1 fimbria component protein) [Kosakonia arachidis]|uniref:Pilin (Type 1 fimbria component protein) n=1 Tax=Kosakonia arachidis TaxID=551989 RepID=A0A1I6XIF2_9ENTR|nr:fimbrial protein [Kosakonia arachidis]SFT37857.1 Pilin (type 1 fimbria component protein) [Kosakonia arachidis]
MFLNVKKNSVACSVAIALITTSWGVHADDPTTDPAQVSVKFKATVTAQTCTPNWDTADGVTVDFKKVSSKALAIAGSVGSARPFTLSLKECAGVTGVTVIAGGTADDNDANSFANTNTDTTAAKNVGFRLLGGDQQKAMVPNDASTAVEYIIPSTDDGAGGQTYADHLTMPFLAQLVATADNATPGDATGEATLYLAYE